MKENFSHYPNTRMRRLRRTSAIRNLVSETSLSSHDLIYPAFITESEESEDIGSMPGTKRLCLNDLLQLAEKLVSLNIPAIALFPVIQNEKKTVDGKEAFNSNGLIQKAISKLKSQFPELIVISDVALDPYTTLGQDGIIDENSYVLN